MRISIIALTGCLMLSASVRAQDVTGKTLREHYVDSIKHSTYPYKFPIWGQKVANKGIDIPWPAGEMLNYFGGSQLVTISNLQVGFNNGALVPLDFIKFGQVKANLQ